ncbi:ABC transporter ATP-binding protein [Bradyrhizobium sp. NP1]|uniref:ABC transporter ATP-binding protein n=1 Tax=Bradyrhizobium sp. NP1 TaxID=3049772 RepID=UPI0025A670E9|nr:ABC transporter ATP-binding protein [Bradyrhizobium sp. NP1]WJR79243.1 ABC transporter ATP-binding protein [Bradyrhizobium sp. NP1]
MDGASLEVSNLIKTFGRGRVVDDVSFSLPAGGLLTLLGPSGSGKTTTMRMVAGFETPTSGDVRVDGDSIVDLSAHRRNIGVVFQQYALFPHLSVFENVAYPLEMRRIGRAQIKQRVEAALETVRLGGFEARRPKQLSGGQQQRVALARALVFQPRLLLMDEPLGALDKRLRELMQVEIRQLQQKLGITTISVTHDQVEALVMSDLVAVLDGGRLQQLGPPLEVYQRPANRFVADFLGESNLLSGSCQTGADGQVRFISAKGLASEVGGATTVEGPACVVIRPEHIVIGREAERLPNICHAKIRDALYIGDLVKYRVVTESGEELTAKALAGVAISWRVGEEVPVGWRSEHCLTVAQ